MKIFLIRKFYVTHHLIESRMAVIKIQNIPDAVPGKRPLGGAIIQRISIPSLLYHPENVNHGTLRITFFRS